MKGTFWTEAEDQVLHEIWHAEGSLHLHMHRIPERKYDAAIQRAARLGLGRRYIEWTAEEDAILREMWAQGALKSQMSRLPSRSWKAMLTRAEKLKLPKRAATIFNCGHSWVDDAAYRLLRSGIPMNSHEMATRIGASQSRLRLMLSTDTHNHFRIVGWEHISASNAGSWTPIWSIGSEPDVPKPKKTGAERMRILRAKKKRPAHCNPFAAALGLTQAPAGVRGRVIKHLHDDEMEAA